VLPSAEIFTPERAWTALLVDATLVTVCNCRRSSDVERDIFTARSYGNVVVVVSVEMWIGMASIDGQ
jgi:hypothetical protein